MSGLFYDIGIIIIVATFFALIARFAKQPLIIAYILSGIILGPVLRLIYDITTIRTISEIGIAFLLFVVGLELDFSKLRHVTIVAVGVGLIKSFVLFGLTYVISLTLAFSSIEALYLAFIISISSTMVVVKLLSDKYELDTLHARIIIGILLIEDIIAIFALTLTTALNAFTGLTFLITLIKGIFLLVISYIFVKILPRIIEFSAKSTELLFITSLSICFIMAFISLLFGFSIVIGAFLAGLILANLPYKLEIIARVKPLKDFFSSIFFVSLGLDLSLKGFIPMIPAFFIFLFIIIIIKPLLIMILSSMFGYLEKISFYVSTSLMQISEFSIILAYQGYALGHLSEGFLSMITLLAVLTMSLTSYTISYNNKIYSKMARYFKWSEEISPASKGLQLMPEYKIDVILCGYNRIGYSILKTLHKINKKVFVVDFNPEVIKLLVEKKIPCIYGDISDLDIVERLPIKEAKIIISTVPDKHANILLIRRAKRIAKHILVFVTASQIDEALDLYNEGADYVIMPHFLGGYHTSKLVEEVIKKKKVIDLLKEQKEEHIKELHIRKAIGHEHPRHEK